MRIGTLVIIVIFSLALVGLSLVQFQWLKAGIVFEKERFENGINEVLSATNLYINQNTALQKLLLKLAKGQTNPEEHALLDTASNAMEHFLDQQFDEKGIGVAYSFALTRGYQHHLLLGSLDHTKEAADFSIYQKKISGQLSAACRCQLSIHIRVHNLFGYLLNRLAYLIFSSVVFIILLMGSLVFLLLMLRNRNRLHRVKNDFINNLTHELKTPVFSISLITKVLRQTPGAASSEKALAYLSLIDKENALLKGHIEKVLELASLEKSKYALQLKLVDIHELIRSIAQHFEAKVMEQGGQLNLDLATGEFNLQLDAVHFRNVIQNLLENALKYSNRTPIITIRTIKQGKHFELYIEDNGIGVAPEHQRKIFDKFYRVSNGNLHDVKGFGLGLNYVKQIVEAHKGRISIKSQLGTGATFLIRLPAKIKDKAS